MLPDVYRICSDTNINNNRRDADIIKRELDEAKDHTKFVMRVCATQVREHRYFLFEHPASATS